ncbi:MAG TPA: hypothetical protein VLT92_13355 [Burkholderiales bacterium]|nr:hypothetical protein [Burkholderiales bacterium]
MLTGIAHPVERKFTARLRSRAELQISVGRGTRTHVGMKYLGAIAAAAHTIMIKAGSHRMLESLLRAAASAFSTAAQP